MANRKQSFEATYSALGIHYMKRLLPQYLTVEAHGADNKLLPSKIMFYANTALSIKGLSETLEEFFDSSNVTKDIDVLLVHMNLSKGDKGAFIGAFTTTNNTNNTTSKGILLTSSSLYQMYFVLGGFD